MGINWFIPIVDTVIPELVIVFRIGQKLLATGAVLADRLMWCTIYSIEVTFQLLLLLLHTRALLAVAETKVLSGCSSTNNLGRGFTSSCRSVQSELCTHTLAISAADRFNNNEAFRRFPLYKSFQWKKNLQQHTVKRNKEIAKTQHFQWQSAASIKLSVEMK